MRLPTSHDAFGAMAQIDSEKVAALSSFTAASLNIYGIKNMMTALEAGKPGPTDPHLRPHVTTTRQPTRISGDDDRIIALGRMCLEALTVKGGPRTRYLRALVQGEP